MGFQGYNYRVTEEEFQHHSEMMMFEVMFILLESDEVFSGFGMAYTSES